MNPATAAQSLFETQTFIVTVAFENADKDDVAVAVDAPSTQDAINRAHEVFVEEGIHEAFAQTIAEFESDFGTYTPGMFEAI